MGMVVNPFAPVLNISGYTALRLRGLTNGGTHRTSIAELDFLLGGVEISKAGITAFSGGGGSDQLPPSNAFDDDASTYWSRISSFGTGICGAMGYPSGTAPTALRLTTSTGDIFGQDAPWTFVIEGSTDTTTGLDGTWATLYNGSTSWSGAGQVQTFTF